MKRESDYILIAARRPSDGMSMRVGYLPGAEKPYLLILGCQALNSYKTKGGASRALCALAELFAMPEGGYYYTALDGCAWEVEKNVALLCGKPMRRETVKVPF